MSSAQDLVTALEGTPDLLGQDLQPRGLLALVQNLMARVQDLERAGVPRTSSSRRIPLGGKDDTIVVAGGLEFDAEAQAAFDAATAISSTPDSVLITDGAGAQKGNAVGTNEVVARVGTAEIDGLPVPAQSLVLRQAADLIALTIATNEILLRAGGSLAGLGMGTNTALIRAGGDVQALSMGASTILARLAAGNLKACTPAEILTLIGAADTSLGNVAQTRKQANYTLVATDFLVAADTSAGGFTLTLFGSPIQGQRVIIFDAEGTFNTGNLTIAGGGNNINGAASKTTGARWAIITLIYDATGKWVAGTTTAL